MQYGPKHSITSTKKIKFPRNIVFHLSHLSQNDIDKVGVLYFEKTVRVLPNHQPQESEPPDATRPIGQAYSVLSWCLGPAGPGPTVRRSPAGLRPA